MMKVSSLPGELCMTSTSLLQSVTCFPLIEIIRSPARNPAAFAGDGTDGLQAVLVVVTHGSTVLICGITEVTPTPKKITKIKIKPSTKCVKEPAPNTTSLFGTEARTNARGASASDNSSCVDIPTIRQ